MSAPKGHKAYGGFKKGFDPNRNIKGRAPIGGSLAERIRAAFERNTPDGLTQQDVVISDAIKMARRGHSQYLQMLWDRGYGKVPDKVEVNQEQKLDLSKLTDEEIKTLMSLLEKAK